MVNYANKLISDVESGEWPQKYIFPAADIGLLSLHTFATMFCNIISISASLQRCFTIFLFYP